MKNIIRAEFYKLYHSKTLWICLTLAIIVALVIPFGIKAAISAQEPDYIDKTWNAMTVYNYGLSHPMLTLVIALFVTLTSVGEFHFGTMKNYLSKGIRRESVFLAKAIVSALGTTAIFLVFEGVLFLTANGLFGFDGSSVFSGAAFAASFFLVWLLLLAYTSLLLMVVFLAKNGMAAIGINICLVSLFPTLLGALNFLFGKSAFKPTSLWLDSMLSGASLLPLSNSAIIFASVGSLGYLAASLAFGIWRFKKADIK